MGIVDGKTCIVTGGAGSIGLAAARALLAEGARVMLVDLDSASLPGIVADLSTEREDFVAADVMDAEQTRNYVEKTIKRFGKIDMLGDRIDGRWRVLRLTASS